MQEKSEDELLLGAREPERELKIQAICGRGKGNY